MRLRSRPTSALLALAVSALWVAPASVASAAPSPATPAEDVVPGEVLVRWAAGTPAAERASERARFGLQTAGHVGDDGYELLTMDASEDPRAVAAELRRRGRAAAAQPNFVYALQADPVDDPHWPKLWGLHQTNDVDLDVLEAWQVTQGAADVVVAVIDSGVQVDHPDLAANMWVNPDEIAGNGVDDDANGKVDDLHGWDFFNNDAGVYHGDEDDHGTHIAGTIAATADNGAGIAGVAPGVRVMALKFLGPEGTGSTSKAIQAIAYAKAEGARVINASWGYAGSGDTAMRDAIRNSNAVFVAAAGNEGTDNDVQPFQPANADASNIVSVAAVTSTGDLAGWSNRGDQTVDVGAPGASIYSTLPGGTYGYMSGTSMAAPHVAGVAALLASAVPSLSVADIVGLLKTSSTASPLSSLAGKTITGGMPNARTAIDAISTPVWPQGSSLTIAGVTDTGFTVSWPEATDNAGVADYVVTVGAAAEVAVTGLGHVVTGLSEGTAHIVSVRPRDADGNLGAALTTTATTATVTPAWPTGAALTAGDITANGFQVSWPEATDDVAVAGYEVTVGAADPVALTADVTTLTVSDVTEATAHAVEVVAVDADGRESSPLATSVTTLSSSPVWPADAAISASSISTSGFTVSWPAASDDIAVVGYAVTVGSEPAVVVTGLSHAVTGLAAGTSYPVTVVALDADDRQSTALSKTVTTGAVTSGGGGGGGGGGFAPAPTAPSAPAPDEPTAAEPVEEDTTTDADQVAYDGTAARTLDLACPTAPTAGWSDVPADSTHAAGIGCATAWEVFLGGDSDTFSPGTRLSRGQLASVLARAIEQASGEALAAGADAFGDDDGSVHERAIDALAAIGIVGGTDADSYAPTAAVTRAQFAAMLGRTYRHLVGTLPAGADVFGDDDGNTHEAAIDALAGLGIVTGDGQGSYLPADVLTRAQSATMVARLIDALVEAGAAG